MMHCCSSPVRGAVSFALVLSLLWACAPQLHAQEMRVGQLCDGIELKPGERCCPGPCGSFVYDTTYHGCCNGYVYHLDSAGCCNGTTLYNLDSAGCCNGTTVYYFNKMACGDELVPIEALQSDSNNCGGIGQKCPTGQQCCNGECVPKRYGYDVVVTTNDCNETGLPAVTQHSTSNPREIKVGCETQLIPGQHTGTCDRTVTTCITKPVPLACGEMVAANAAPVVFMTASDPVAGEGGNNPGTIAVWRTGGTSNALTVHYRITGTARNGRDYKRLPGTLTIPAGESSAVILIQPRTDRRPEDEETVTLILQTTEEQAYRIVTNAGQ